MKTKIGSAVFCPVAFTNANAQDTTKNASIKFSGNADIYYRYDFSEP